MSLDEFNRMFENSMGWSNALATQNRMHDMFEKSMGISNVLSLHNNMSAMIERSLGTSHALSGMTSIVNALSKHNSIWGIHSNDWIDKSSALQKMTLPNNVFNLSKGLGQGIAGAMSRDFGQHAMTKVLTQGISSIIGDSSFNKFLTTQHNILNRLTDLGQIGLKQNQFRNVFNTLGSLSANITFKGLSSSFDTASYPYLEEVATEVEVITNSVAKQQYVTASDLSDIYILLDGINNKIASINKSEYKTFGFWLCLIALFITIYPLIQQKINASNPNVAPATQQQIKDLRDKLISTYHNNIDIYSPTRIANRKCKIFLKPRLKSQPVMIVSCNEKLSVINSMGKWVMVTCLDQDSLPVTGWVLKKYLGKSPSVKK